MVGLLVGAFVFSSISDHFGRKLSFFMSFGFLVSTLATVIVVFDKSLGSVPVELNQRTHYVGCIPNGDRQATWRVYKGTFQ